MIFITITIIFITITIIFITFTTIFIIITIIFITITIIFITFTIIFLTFAIIFISITIIFITFTIFHNKNHYTYAYSWDKVIFLVRMRQIFYPSDTTDILYLVYSTFCLIFEVNLVCKRMFIYIGYYFLSTNFNKLSIKLLLKYQSHPKDRKIDAFGQEKWLCLNHTHNGISIMIFIVKYCECNKYYRNGNKYYCKGNKYY